MTELNDMGRTEDISLGLNLLFTLGYSDTLSVPTATR